jgi:hypothetical protein
MDAVPAATNAKARASPSTMIRALTVRTVPAQADAWRPRPFTKLDFGHFWRVDVGAQGGEANDAVDWQRFRQETPPCRTCPPASPRSL